MWLRRVLTKLSRWRLPHTRSVAFFCPDMPQEEVISIPVEMASPEIHMHSCQIDMRRHHFDPEISHATLASFELISEGEITRLKLIRTPQVGSTHNVYLLKQLRTHCHIFGSKEFGRSGPTYPCLYPHLGKAFDNPAAFPGNRAPFDFQVAGAEFLVFLQFGILADEMGLGKTVQAIIALRYLFQNAAIRTSLIICPKSILKTWEARLKEWAPELIVVVVENARNQRRDLWQRPAHVYLAGYETVSSDVKREKEFDLVILDEIQKIKNPKTCIHRAVSLISAKRKWGLSGTPIENSIDDLISIFSFLKPGLLSKKINPKIIKKRIGPHILRRLKADVLRDLPQKIHNEVWLELTESQRGVYDEMEQSGLDYLNGLGSAITVKHVIALITKLKLICNLNPITNESSKLDFLKERIAEISFDDKILVFSQFPRKTLRRIMDRMDIHGLLYDGSLSLKERNRIVDLFQHDKEHRVLFISLKSGGYGLNLTRANYVFHFDSWWNPASMVQGEDRVHRIGQNKTVFITYLYTENTIEERIHKLINQKRKLFDSIVTDLTTKKISFKLTKDEIFGLMKSGHPV